MTDDNLDLDTSLIVEIMKKGKARPQKENEENKKKVKKKSKEVILSEIYWKVYDNSKEKSSRLTCPLCGAVGFDIKTVIDTKKQVDYIQGNPIYARKNICKKCGHEWY